MLKTQAVGIDLGTTYSCLSYLNEHGEPVTVPNQEGELSTPSVVMFDGQEVVVGTEALRNAVLKPTHVVQNSKRYIGSNKTWQIQGQTYTPVDIGALILRKMISAAEEQIGEIEQGVITVPAQFSDWQRQATVEAGVKAGLKTVDIINEPVAAALCYVLGTEGLWFSELTDEQRILVYDLGGGTFDLSLVKYHKDEVKVIASTGDLHLGGIDWNEALQNAICDRFAREFGADPRQDPESMQLLAMAVENTKRGLTVRPRAALTCTHGGHRKVYQVEQTEFEKLTKLLLDRSLSITRDLQKAYNFGLKPTDVILTTGGSSRMPMIKRGLGEIGFRTPNTSLSPDQSISHGATYYAGMLLTNTDFAKSILSAKATARLAKIKQRSVNARALGILIRDAETNTRVPHYLIPANTALPCAVEQTFGTVIPNQKRVHLHIIESGTVADQAYVELGTCVVDDLPPKLPENSLVQVTITYNEQARAVVTAKDLTSGKKAQTTIVRLENLVTQPAAQQSASVEDESQVAFTAPSIKPGQSAFGHGASGTGPQSPALPLATSTKLAPAKPSSPAPAANLPKSTTTTAASVSSPKLASAEPKRPIAGKSPSAPQSVAGPRSVLSKPSLEDASQPIPLCDECGEPLDSRGKCHACGWSVSAAKKPAIPPATAMPKASAAKPPSAAAPRKLSPPTKPVSARKKSEDADDELLGDGPVSAAPGKSATTARLADSAAPAPKPGVKPPPLPPGKTLAPPKRPQANGTNRGEEDFWVDDIQS